MANAILQCRICRNAAERSIIVAKEMLLGYRSEHEYFQCGECGCLQITQDLPNMSKYYPDNYYAYVSAARIGRLHQITRNIKAYLTLYGGALVDVVLPDILWPPLRAMARLDMNKDSRILDVGCGNGFLLRVLAGIGQRNLLGIDKYITKDMDHGDGVRVLKRELSEVDGEWDVIMFHHSLEHIWDQRAVMSDVRRLLAAGGTCLIRTPTVSSFAWRHYGANWVQLDAPRHLCLHSTKSMELLASSVGYSVRHVLYDSTAFQFWGSELYKRGVPLVGRERDGIIMRDGYFKRTEIREFAERARRLNRSNDGDQAAFYLQSL